MRVNMCLNGHANSSLCQARTAIIRSAGRLLSHLLTRMHWVAVVLSKVVMSTPNDDKVNDICIKTLIQYYKVSQGVCVSGGGAGTGRRYMAIVA